MFNNFIRMIKITFLAIIVFIILVIPWMYGCLKIGLLLTGEKL